MRMGRPLAAAIAAAGLLGLAGCLPFGIPLDDGPRPTPVAPSAALAPYYEQSVDWRDCGDGFECADVVAPLDWEHPDPSSDIALAVVRHPATGSSEGSLLVNPGGPGASGFDFVRDSLDFAVSADLREHYDIVGWDPRGVGRTEPVTCYTDPGDVEEWIYGILPADPRAEPDRWVEQYEAAMIDYAQTCYERTGDALEFIDTESTVHDMDLLRAVLGDAGLNFLGYSYGAELGARYVSDFPQNVGRIVMDGAVDPSVPLFDQILQQNLGFQRAFEHYIEQCRDLYDDCPLPADVPSAMARIGALYESLDRRPIAASDGRRMDAGVLDTAINFTLYNQAYWEYLNIALTEALAGVADTSFLLSDAYWDFTPGRGWGSNLMDAFIAIGCVDQPVELDLAVIEEQDRIFQETFPYTSRDLPPTPDFICANWAFQHRGDGVVRLDGAGAPPVLVIATTGDPATPYEWGVAVAEALASARLVTFRGEGHTAYNGSACVTQVVDAYFIDGTVPASDPDCDY